MLIDNHEIANFILWLCYGICLSIFIGGGMLCLFNKNHPEVAMRGKALVCAGIAGSAFLLILRLVLS